MNSFWKRCAMLVAIGLGALSLWACTATRNSDGTISISFAPDMVITAWGLEDALGKLNDLLRSCLDGSFHRTCTDEERADIIETIAKIIDSKAKAPSSEFGDPTGF